MKDTIHIDSKGVKMVAHRGLSGLEKENTAAAFVAAGNRSYFGIETDVHCTGDGKFVVIHDNNTARVALDALEVEKTTFDTLRAIKLCDTDGVTKRADLCIPTLKEYVRICKKYEKVCVLELKNRIRYADIARLIDEIREEEYLDQVIFISFSLENLIDLRAMLPEQPAQFLTGTCNDYMLDTLKKHNLDLDIYYKSLTEEDVKRIKAAGITLNCWTVDDPETAARLIDWGVDQITSNILE